MTAKYKARQLVENMSPNTTFGLNQESSKELAVLFVSGILDELNEWGAPYLFEEATQNDWAEDRLSFWNEVKSEIEKL